MFLGAEVKEQIETRSRKEKKRKKIISYLTMRTNLMNGRDFH